MKARVLWVVLALAACAPKVSLEDAPCPCAAGWVCCPGRDVCVADAAACPAPLDVGSDAGTNAGTDAGTDAGLDASPGDGGTPNYCVPNQCQSGGRCLQTGECSFTTNAGAPCGDGGVCDWQAECVPAESDAGPDSPPIIYYARSYTAYAGAHYVGTASFPPRAMVYVSGANFPPYRRSDSVTLGGVPVGELVWHNTRELAFNLPNLAMDYPVTLPLTIRNDSGSATTLLTVELPPVSDPRIEMTLMDARGAPEIFVIELFGARGVAMRGGTFNNVVVATADVVLPGDYDWSAELYPGGPGWTLRTSPAYGAKKSGERQVLYALLSSVPGCGRQTLTFKAVRRADADGPSVTSWLDVPIRTF